MSPSDLGILCSGPCLAVIPFLLDPSRHEYLQNTPETKSLSLPFYSLQFLNWRIGFVCSRTPLQCAAHGGFVKFMTVLIEHGAYVDHQDKDGITALHRSCASGHLEAVKLLLRNKAFPNFTEGHTDR